MVLNKQTREIVYKLIKFMDEEAKSGVSIPLTKVTERICKAVGISRGTVCKIRHEGIKVENGEDQFRTPNKKRKFTGPVTDVDPMTRIFFKRHIHNYYKIKKQHPTLDKLMRSIKEENLPFKGSKRSLARLLQKLGYRWRRATDNRRFLTEKFEIRSSRTRYLNALRQYRAAERPIVYVDEMYLDENDTKPSAGSDGTASKPRAPISKEPRLIIVNAFWENGFIPNALLIFQSGTKSGDYHDDMNGDNYMKWLKNQLLPNLPPQSVVVMDNASYHNVTIEKNIEFSDKKIDMKKWLAERDIVFNNKMTKIDLYNIIKEKRSQAQQYVADTLLAEHGHTILRLPPHHPELNPIEKMWLFVKNWVAKNSASFKLTDIKKLEEKFAENCIDVAKALCEKVKELEAEFEENEHFLDMHVDDLIIKYDSDASDSEMSSSDGED